MSIFYAAVHMARSTYLAGMTDPFIITVPYQGIATDYTAQLLLQGYSHKFKIIIDGTDVYFEPDEEGQYRVVQLPGQDPTLLGGIDRNLLALLQQQLAALLA